MEDTWIPNHHMFCAWCWDPQYLKNGSGHGICNHGQKRTNNRRGEKTLGMGEEKKGVGPATTRIGKMMQAARYIACPVAYRTCLRDCKNGALGLGFEDD